MVPYIGASHTPIESKKLAYIYKKCCFYRHMPIVLNQFVTSCCDDHVISKVSKGAKIRNRYNQVPHVV